MSGDVNLWLKEGFSIHENPCRREFGIPAAWWIFPRYGSGGARIDGDGVVQGVSYGTSVGNNMQFYKYIPVCPMTYGQALTILLLTEGVRLCP